MQEQKNSKKKVFKIAYVYFAIGLFLALLAISMCLNVGPIAQYVNYGVGYLFGNFFFLPWAILLMLGFYFMFFMKNRKIPHKILIFISSFLIILGILTLLSLFAYSFGEVPYTLDNFVDVFNTIIGDVNSGPIKLSTSLGGGIIGHSLASVFISFLTLGGAYAVTSLLILIGLVILFIPLIIKLIKKSRMNRSEEKKQSLREDNYQDTKDDSFTFPTTLGDRFKEETNIHQTSYDLKREIENDESNTPIAMKEDTLNLTSDENIVTPVYNRADVDMINRPYIIRDDRGLIKAHLIIPGANKSVYEPNRVKEDVIIATPKVDENTNLHNEIKNDVINDQFTLDFIPPLANPQVEENKPSIERPVEHLFTNETREAEIKVLNKVEENAAQNETNLTPPQPKAKPRKPYVFPDDSLLNDYEVEDALKQNQEVADLRVEKINEVFNDLHVGAQVVGYTIGPSITRYDVLTNRDVTVNNVEKVVRDIAIRLDGTLVRFEAIVRGKSTSGLEIPNAVTTTVAFKDVFNALKPIERDKNKLFIPFGKDISGNVIGADIAEFPHFLVAGGTGSGKSVYIHSVLLSLLMRNRPEDLKIILVDPKRVEMSKYKDLPHLLCPIVTEPGKAKLVLDKLVDEMERRYDLFTDVGVSDMGQYNEYARENGLEPLPYILIVVDEYADLVQTVKEVQAPIMRLGQKSRAAGIHMLIATQRPSVNVITGDIKANIQVRVALATSSATDSVTILGEGGAELLLGKGDMLVDCALISRAGLTRLQSAFVSNQEILRVVKFIKDQMEPQYDERFLNLEEKSVDTNDYSTAFMQGGRSGGSQERDEMYDIVKEAVQARDFCSISWIQREFGFGFPRSGRIFAQLKQDGIVANEPDSPSSNKGSRVLIKSSNVINMDEHPNNEGLSPIKTLDDDDSFDDMKGGTY